jgi:superoxide reductase
MNIFVCGKCGYVAFNESPDRCPVCGAPKAVFALDAQAIKQPQDPNNLNELEKKHTPTFLIERKCGLAGPGCIDAHIKVGEILHVMEERHYIIYIDLYLDYKFIARYHMEPGSLNPILGIHLKVSQGKLLALENCNLHGRWMAQTEL